MAIAAPARSTWDNGKFSSISEDEFKAGMRHLAASVNVITVRHDGVPGGLTATAACSVSAEPPQLLICVNGQAGAHDSIAETGTFCLNILARHQEDIARRFAGMDGADPAARFDLGGWCELQTGAPALDDALSNLDCVVVQQVAAGTHSIFIGRIVGARAGPGAPLIYGDGGFTGLG